MDDEATGLPWDEADGDDTVYAGFLPGMLENSPPRGMTWLGRAVSDTDTDTDTDPDKGKGDTSFVASNGTEDRHGDVVDAKTWVTSHYKHNNVVLADHWGPVVGAGKVWRGREAGQIKDLRITVRWDDSPVNIVGMLLAHQHRNGFRHAVSVGFIPGVMTNRRDLPADHPFYVSDTVDRWRAGYLYSKNELLEVSSVAVPANRDALELSADMFRTEHRDAGIARYVRDTTPRNVAEDILTALRTDKQVRREILAILLADRNATAHTPQQRRSYVPPGME